MAYPLARPCGRWLRALSSSSVGRLRAPPAWALLRRGYASYAADPATQDVDPHLPIKCDIGEREVVGFGVNGQETYIDNVHYPFPAIRFKEDKGELQVLREKEKGDWNKMTKEEIKCLYRGSFAQTLVEIEAPTGQWRFNVGGLCIAISLALWWFMWLHTFVSDPLPDTITDPERLRAQVDRMIKLRVNPIEGFASNYDYEKNEWKRKP